MAKLRASGRAVFAILVLLSGWLMWLTFGKASIYVASQQAHLEASHFPQPIQAAANGIVVECNLSLAQRVRPGEVLVRLDARAYELELAEAQANLSSDVTAMRSLNEEIAAEEKARDAIARLVQSSARSGHAKVAVSETTERFQKREAQVLKALSEKELASKLDELRSEQLEATNHAQVAATSAQAAVETNVQTATLFERDVQIVALTKLLSDAESHADVVRAKIDMINYEIDRRQVRTNAAGTLADIVPCTPGMTVTTDNRLATLLPDSDVRVVTLFRPEDAVGRIKSGQPATLRIDNYPWTQFGTVGATVERVGTEPRDGLVRVELNVTRSNPAIPIIHGLSGVAEIQVERVTPFQLLMRTIGSTLSPVAEARPSSSASR